MLEEVKNYLKITWEDEDLSLENMIQRGKNNLESLTGTKLDFTIQNQAKSLLLDYCRYAYNNSTEYFEENYQKELNRLIFQEAIKDSNPEGDI